MKIITTRVNCRGCHKGQILKFKEPGWFRSSTVPYTCEKCGSDLIVEVKKAFLKKKIHIRVKILKHTRTLLNILKKRQAHA